MQKAFITHEFFNESKQRSDSMKIEKINDKQIRCTISKSDLAERKIKLSELACGTGNSKELFRDMIRQASDDFGFEVDDIPLMVEAIPVSPECIILILTKVDNPEETESHFAQLLGEEEMDLMDRLEEIDLNPFEDSDSDYEEDSQELTDSSAGSLLFCIYRFDDLNEVIKLSKMLHPIYEGDSSLFKSPFNNKYYLSLCTDTEHKGRLKYVSNILSEHGTREHSAYNSEYFFIEHFECIVAENAIEKLSAL